MVDKELGLKVGTMGKRALRMSQLLLKEKDQLAQLIKKDYPEAKIVTRISDLIGKRCKSLERQGL